MSEVIFRKVPTDSGYIYGECTNEFVEQNKDAVPTITSDDVFINSINRLGTNWSILGKYYLLDEEFMEEYFDKIDLIQVSKYQNITMDFINRHKEKLDLDMMSTNVKLSQEMKDEIEKMGVAKFNEFCRSKVLKYVDEWKIVINRLGRWADMENSYKTMDLSFMESVWWVFKQLWEKGLIYGG